MSDEEINTLLEYVGTMNGAVASRALGSVGKGIAGLVSGLAATQAAEAAIEEAKNLFKREASFDELD